MIIKDIINEGFFGDWYAQKQVINKGVEEFYNRLAGNGIEINKLTPEETENLKNYLKKFVMAYMALGEERGVQPLVVDKIDSIEVPKKLTRTEIINYFSLAANARKDALEEFEKQVPRISLKPEEPPKEEPTDGPKLAEPTPLASKNITTPGGVQILRLASRDAAGKPTPTIVQYNKQKFALSDDGAWVNVMSGKPVNPALASFLQTELETL